MTTDVHERLAAPPLAPERPHGARAWLTFLVTVLLAAVVIGVIAALLGNAARGLNAASAAEEQAQAALQVAGQEADAAQAALEAGQAALDARRQAVLDEIAAPGQQPGFSSNASSVAFAEVDAMANSLATNEVPAVDAANATKAQAEVSLDAASDQVIAAQQEVDRLVTPLWITIGAGLLLVGLVLWAAIARTRSARRR
jgi:hypothetical protein